MGRLVRQVELLPNNLINDSSGAKITGDTMDLTVLSSSAVNTIAMRTYEAGAIATHAMLELPCQGLTTSGSATIRAACFATEESFWATGVDDAPINPNLVQNKRRIMGSESDGVNSVTVDQDPATSGDDLLLYHFFVINDAAGGRRMALPRYIGIQISLFDGIISAGTLIRPRVIFTD